LVQFAGFEVTGVYCAVYFFVRAGFLLGVVNDKGSESISFPGYRHQFAADAVHSQHSVFQYFLAGKAQVIFGAQLAEMAGYFVHGFTVMFVMNADQYKAYGCNRANDDGCNY
jgi:hypothetical protein